VARLTPAMRTLVNRQRLGFVATVRPEGTPRLSAHGTLAVWEPETLVFADIVARGTVSDLLENAAIEVVVVDPLRRKGWRFAGTARLLLSGPTFDRLQAFYRRRGIAALVHHMVLVHVERVEPLVSPVYLEGWSEEQVTKRWAEHLRRQLPVQPGRAKPRRTTRRAAAPRSAAVRRGAPRRRTPRP
jgi:uncharacterized protein